MSWWQKVPAHQQTSQIVKFMEPTWGPPQPRLPQMGPMLAPWTLLWGVILIWVRNVTRMALHVPYMLRYSHVNISFWDEVGNQLVSLVWLVAVRVSLYYHWLNVIPAYLITYPVKCWKILLIDSQTSTAVPLMFGNNLILHVKMDAIIYPFWD